MFHPGENGPKKGVQKGKRIQFQNMRKGLKVGQRKNLGRAEEKKHIRGPRRRKTKI